MGGLALGTVVTGLPLTELAIYTGDHGSWVAWQSKLWIFWAVLAIVYGAGAVTVLVRNRRRRQQTADPRNESRGGHRTRIVPRHS